MTDNPQPDFSVCGRPVVELLGLHSLDEHVEQAAKLAVDNPRVGIAICVFPGEILLPEFNTWTRRQRELLAAWRAGQSIKGQLRLRTRSIVRPGENLATAAFVLFSPFKTKPFESEGSA